MKELDNLISRINIMEQTLSNEWSDDEFLFHALRFQPLEKLESIIKTGYIFPASQVTRKFSSYDGTIKNIHLYDYDDNCNLGKFVSLTGILISLVCGGAWAQTGLGVPG